MDNKYIVDVNNEVQEDIEFYEDDFVDEEILGNILSGTNTIQDDEFCDEDFYDDINIKPISITYPHQGIEVIDATSSILNIRFTKMKSGNYNMKSDNDMFSESYYYEPSMMFNALSFERFLDSCKRTFRNSLGYENYIAYLRHEVGLITDVFNSNITQDNARLEVHHGPVFSLDDIIRILIDYSFDHGLLVSAAAISSLVMNEHGYNRVQVALVSENNHALIHANKLFLDFKQCHGNIQAFTDLYWVYIKRSPHLLNRINRYRLQLKNPPDNSFITPGKLINWSNR